MHTGHDPVVIANTGNATTLNCTFVKGAKFADVIPVADDQFGIFATIFFVLRIFADGRKLVYPVVFTQGGSTGQNYVGSNPATRIDFHIRADDSKWPDFNIVGQIRARIDHGPLVDHAPVPLGSAQINSALAPFRPLTVAVHS